MHNKRTQFATRPDALHCVPDAVDAGVTNCSHLHAKLFPMHGTGQGSEFKPIASSVNKYFDHYEGYISSHDYKREDDDVLAELAARIRA